MSLTLETLPELEARLAADAARAGMDTARYTAELLWRLYWPAPAKPATEAEQTADWQQLLSYAGCLDSGDTSSADNLRIDTDLAQEYGAIHRETA